MLIAYTVKSFAGAHNGRARSAGLFIQLKQVQGKTCLLEENTSR